MNQVVVERGTGEVQTYENLYAAVTPEMVERAETLERQILHTNANIQVKYFELGKMLVEFKNEKLYLARGLPTFKDWADSDDLKGLGSRTAYNLVRIAEDLLPILDKHGFFAEDSTTPIPGISTLYDMLPILNDEDAEDKIVRAVKDVQGLPTRGAKDAIKEIRGIKTEPEEQPALFKCVYQPIGDHIRFDMWCSTGDDFYQVNERGPLMVRKADWPRLEQMFRGYVEAKEKE